MLRTLLMSDHQSFWGSRFYLYLKQRVFLWFVGKILKIRDSETASSRTACRWGHSEIETVAVPLSGWQDSEILKHMFKWFYYLALIHIFSGLNIKPKYLLQSSFFFFLHRSHRELFYKILWFHFTEMVGFRTWCIGYYIINSPIDRWRKCLKVDLKATGRNSCGFAGLKRADRMEWLGARGMSLRKKWFLDSSTDARSVAKLW